MAFFILLTSCFAHIDSIGKIIHLYANINKELLLLCLLNVQRLVFERTVDERVFCLLASRLALYYFLLQTEPKRNPSFSIYLFPASDAGGNALRTASLLVISVLMEVT